jgi:beta-ureidopropionase
MKPNQYSRRNFVRTAALGSGMASLAVPGMAYERGHSSERMAKDPRDVWIAGFSQMWLRADSAEAMVDKVWEQLGALEALRPDFLCLPEVFPFEMISKKYRLPEMLEISEKVLERFSAFARQNNCYTVCPVYTTENGQHFNSSVFFGRDGNKIGVYHKIHPTAGEIDNGVAPGPLYQPAVPTEFGPVGSQICFDINWDDGWSMYRKQGVRIMFWPSAFDGGIMVNAKAWQHHYVVATSTNQNNAKLCDIGGETLAQTGIWNKYLYCAPVNLEKVFLHLYPAVFRFPEIQKKYGRKIRIAYYHEEQWAVIESLSPDLRVADVLKEFDLMTHEEHIEFGDKAQQKARKS